MGKNNDRSGATPGSGRNYNGRRLPKHFAAYLNDHLAASVTAVKLLSRLKKQHDGLSSARFAWKMRNEVQKDQHELKRIMRRLRVKQSRTRKATGWIAQKLTELKLKLDDPANGGLGAFELLEIVEIGIEGKRCLWRTLSATSQKIPELRGFDYQQLIERAKQQHDQFEAVRLEVAMQAFSA